MGIWGGGEGDEVVADLAVGAAQDYCSKVWLLKSGCGKPKVLDSSLGCHCNLRALQLDSKVHNNLTYVYWLATTKPMQVTKSLHEV